MNAITIQVFSQWQSQTIGGEDRSHSRFVFTRFITIRPIILLISRRLSLVMRARKSARLTETGDAIVSNTRFYPIRIVSRHTQPCSRSS
jgi:hypothetical protein